MKKPNNILLGLIGGISTMAAAPGLILGGYYIIGVMLFIGGLAIIDWNRNGN